MEDAEDLKNKLEHSTEIEKTSSAAFQRDVERLTSSLMDRDVSQKLKILLDLDGTLVRLP